MSHYKEAIIVFTGNKRHKLGKYIRTICSEKRLKELAGEENANKALQSIKKIKTDKHTIKLRKHGRIEIYLK